MRLGVHATHGLLLWFFFFQWFTSTLGSCALGCNSSTSCCSGDTPVCSAGTCVSNCTFPDVQDPVAGKDDQCIPLQACGDHCVQCNTTGKCIRCQALPVQYRLQGAECVLTCTHGAPSIVVEPLFSVVCPSQAPPSTADDNDSGANNTNKTGGTDDRSNNNNEEEGGLSSLAVIVIGAGAGSVVLLCIVAACYICRGSDSCCRNKGTRVNVLHSAKHNYCVILPGRYPNDQSGGIELGHMSHRLNNGPGVMSLEGDGGGAGEATVDGLASTSSSPKPMLKNPTVLMGLDVSISGTEEQQLTGPEEREFLDWLHSLKKHKSKFALLAKEMRQRQNAQVTVADRQRYDKVVSNFDRVLELMSQPKRQRSAPFDGMQLLDWAQKTIDKFNATK
eukprot:m.367799 g.367799  ORF g.367799 m.367799 type:complete len:390 (+) comp20838_c0_seq7:183-1352(+)